MRLRPALIMLGVFAVVIGALAVFVATYEPPRTDESGAIEDALLFPGLVAADIEKIEIVSPKLGKEPVVIERTGESRTWRMTRPVRVLVCQDKVDRLIKDFVGLRAARGFPSRSFDEYDLTEPRFRLTATTRAGEVIAVAFGSRVPEVARAGTQVYADFYSFEKRGGTAELVPHRYARIGDREQVLIVRDDVCPQIDLERAALREPLLLYAENAAGIAPIVLPRVRTASITVREGERVRTVILVRSRRKGWRLRAPVDARADQKIVHEALTRALQLKAADAHAYVDEDPADLGRYGLDKPSVVLELQVLDRPRGENLVRHTVRFGASPKGRPDLVYAQSSSRKAVLLVGSDVVNDRLRDRAENFRDRHLVAFGEPAVQSMTLVYGAGRPRITIARRKDPTRWLITEPVTGRASRPAALGLVSRVTRLMVQPGGFVGKDPGDIKESGLDAPQVTILFKLKGGRTATVLIGRSPADPRRAHLVYARNTAEPSVVLVAKGIVEDLSPGIKSIRSRRLLEDYSRGEACELHILRGKDKISLRRADAVSWEFVEPVGYNVQDAAPSAFLAMVEALRITAWPADKPGDYRTFGLDKPHAVLTIKTAPVVSDRFKVKGEDERKERTFVVWFGKRAGGGKRCYVRLASEPNVYEVDADILGWIDRGYLAFRDRQVLDFSKAAVRSLRIEGGRTDYAAQKAPGGEWLLSEPPLLLSNGANINALLGALSKLRAKELVCKGHLADPRYGLKPRKGRPHRTVILNIEERKYLPREDKTGKKFETIKTTETLVVGAPASGDPKGDRYAVVAKDEIVFVIPAGVVRMLDKEFAPAQIMDVPKSAVRAVTVRHRDGSGVELTRRADGTWAVGHTAVLPDQVKIGELVDAARQITAKSYVAYDRANLAKYGLSKPRLSVTLACKGKLPEEALDIGDPAEGSMFYATGCGVRAIFLVSARTFKALSKHVEDVIVMRKQRK